MLIVAEIFPAWRCKALLLSYNNKFAGKVIVDIVPIKTGELINIVGREIQLIKTTPAQLFFILT